MRQSFNNLRKLIEKKSIFLLRLSLGLVFLWFGALKFFNVSPAEDIASATIGWLSFGTIKADVALPMLATIECVIGLCIIARRFIDYIIPILYLQMCGTLLPLIIFTDKTWDSFLVPTLEGQYIIKNMVLIAAALTVSASSKGRLPRKDTAGV